MNANNNNDRNNKSPTGNQSQPMVPLLVPTTKKKGSTAKKPRVRPTKKKSSSQTHLVALSKRKVNKIGAVGGAGGVSLRSGNNGASIRNKFQRVGDKKVDNNTTTSQTRDQNLRDDNVAENNHQQHQNSTAAIDQQQRRSTKSTSISIGSSIQKRNERQLVTQSQLSSQQSTAADTSSSTTTANAASTSTTNIRRNYTIDERNIIPYQHLGKLDPAWNIPPPGEDEKTMKDYCAIPRGIRKKRNKRDDENDGQDQNNSNNNENNTTAATTSANSTNDRANRDDQGRQTNNQVPIFDPEAPDQRSGPLVEVINGEIVIKESTMIIGGRRSTEEVDRELNNAVIEEDYNTLNVSYRSFALREKSLRWNVDETRKFYIALRQCGTDFTTMQNYFDGSDGQRKRSRRQLKSKYNIECRKNWKLIDMAMNPKAQMRFDLSIFGDLDMENANGIMSLNNETTASADQANTEGKEDGQDKTVGNDLQETTTSTNSPSANPLNTVTPSTNNTTVEQTDPSTIDEGIEIIEEDIDGKLPKSLGSHKIGESSILVTQQDLDKHQDQEKKRLKQDKKEPEMEKLENIPIVLPGLGSKRKKKPKFRARPKPSVKGKSKK